MNSLHLFAGIGGGILADKILGNRIVGAVEIEPYCRAVLKQRQEEGIIENFPIFEDIRNFKGDEIKERVDLVCGGFPCQDISAAGKGAGINGKSLAYSMNLFASAGLLDLDSYSLKIPLQLLGEVSKLSSKKLPRSGTMRNGLVYQRDNVAPLINASGGGAYANGPKDLSTWVYKNGGANLKGAKTIQRQLKQGVFPTPTVWDGTHGVTNSLITELRCRDSPNLSVFVIATTEKKAGGKLNPTWIEWLMGFPMGWTELKIDLKD